MLKDGSKKLVSFLNNFIQDLLPAKTVESLVREPEEQATQYTNDCTASIIQKEKYDSI